MLRSQLDTLLITQFSSSPRSREYNFKQPAAIPLVINLTRFITFTAWQYIKKVTPLSQHGQL
jgi:hypothetical protein